MNKIYIGDSTASEREGDFLCDSHPLTKGDTEIGKQILYRAITINSSSAIIFRWLLQMKIAPYSYDLIDNLGRKSPETLTSGAELLTLDDTFMFIFKLIDFRQNREICIQVKETKLSALLFGDGIISYKLVEDGSKNNCRLIVKLKMAHSRPLITIKKLFIAVGDYIMMQKQLQNFKRLAEKQTLFLQ